jgi:cell wall-associated protease
MKIGLKKTSLCFLLLSNALFAANIAIVDSGNDFLHKDLINKVWTNNNEIPDNDRDEDKNGYPDDIYGWNFAEGNNQLIDYKYADSYNENSKKFFDVQLRAFLGTLTDEDRVWYQEKIKDPAFIKNLQIFGNWMHGTHVTGITVKNADYAKAIGIKLIPTEVKIPGKDALLISSKNQRNEQFYFDKNSDSSIKDKILKAALGALATQQAQIFTEIGVYIAGTNAQVMNGSFGTSYSSIEGLIGTIFEKLLRKKATKEELKEFTDYFFAKLLNESKKLATSSPKTLFVFAAGNEGSNNDIFPTSPASIDAQNKLTVAATLGHKALANFSNFGEKNVEVAAPGVGILSTIPKDHYLAVSGTSQAAPFVANIAGMVFDANPKLSVLEIKKIIMETVDVKEWLKGKVSTSGIVNRDRAIRAAELSNNVSISSAILKAKKEIGDFVEYNEVNLQQVPNELVLPLLNPIII